MCSSSGLWRLGVAVLVAVGLACDTSGGILRTQTISLHRGWNAVFLEVSPVDNEPSIVFSNLPVRTVAAHFPISSPVQFIKNPGTIAWKKDGWAVWYASSRADAFLSTLHAIDGNQAYLIQADRNCTWSVQGSVTFEPPRWKNDSFNLLGFGVNALSPPTFQKFFAGSPAHQPTKIYRLENDRWVAIQDPVTETLHSGEAYWIYSKGTSDFQGPLNLRLPAGFGAVFSDDSSQCPLVLRNNSTDPLAVTIEGASALPLTYMVRAIGDAAMVDVPVALPSPYALPTLEPGERSSLKLELRSEQLATPSASCLLKVTTDIGTETWLPVSAVRRDVSNNP